MGNVPRPLLVVVGHHSRSTRADALAQRVGADAVLTDRGAHGARWIHAQALAWASERRERVWVLEDDAIAPGNLRERASEWGRRFPHDLVSGYLGRQRPPQYQGQIRSMIAAADARGNDWLILPTLIHGVCYSLPARASGRVLGNLPSGPADFAIGAAWGKPTLYTLPSLVDHADGPSVERHPDGQKRTPGRVAWRPPEGV